MSRRLKANQLAERALRLIRAFAINDEQADAEELLETLYWMDMAVAYRTGTEKCHWLQTETVAMVLAEGQTQYDLADELGTAWPSTGIAWVTAAYYSSDTSGTIPPNQDPMDFLTRRQYEERKTGNFSNPPSELYIDRQTENEQVFLLTPPSSVPGTIYFVLQKLAKDLVVNPTNPGNLDHGFHQPWQLWITLETALYIGSGPVRKLPVQEIEAMRAQANDMWEKLNARNDKESRDEPKRVQPWSIR